MGVGGVISCKRLNQRIAGIDDVLTSQSRGKPHVAGRDGIEDGVMLPDDILGPHELAGLHLAYTQLNLAHQKIVHSGQARAGLGHDESAMEIEIGTCEGRSIVESGMLGQVAVNGQCSRGYPACSREIANRGIFENRTVPVQVVDVIATQLRHLRGMVCAPGEQAFGNEPLKGGFCCGPRHPVVLGDRSFCEERARGLERGDNSGTQRFVDRLGQRGRGEERFRCGRHCYTSVRGAAVGALVQPCSLLAIPASLAPRSNPVLGPAPCRILPRLRAACSHSPLHSAAAAQLLQFGPVPKCGY